MKNNPSTQNFSANECEQIGRKYYLQNQTGIFSDIMCPVCKNEAVIFGIQEDGMTFFGLHEETRFNNVEILHFRCDTCEREGRFPQ